MLPDITTMPLAFLRPMWLLGLIAIIIFSLFRYKYRKNSAQQAIIAPHLSANIVSNGAQTTKQQFAFTLLAGLACLALSGPTWRSVDMPVYEMEKAQVIAFDLSYSMFATDVKPSRLAQAKFKAIDLIKHWSEGEKALIAYAGDAFTVAPLTRDGNAIINHIPHLSPDIMPIRGSRADIALDKAIQLLKNAGYQQGHIVFISDDITEQQAKIMQETLQGSNWVVSILAMATPKGAPIKLTDGALLKSNSGEIIVPKLNGQPFYDITRASNGLYLTTRNNSSDIEQLGDFFDKQQTRKSESEQASTDQFAIDDGYWLSFLLLPLFLLLFRKGVFFALLLALSLPFTSPKLEAAETSIWRNNQQNAYQAYQQEQYQLASELYQNDFDRGAALYKNKQYQEALEAFTEAASRAPDHAEVFYNQGNSYAQLQELDKAIDAYDKALAINPDFTQAEQNKQIVEQLKNQQQEQQSNDQQDKQQSEKQNQQSDQQDEQQSEGQNQQNEQQDEQQSEAQNQQNEQQDEQQSEAQKQQSEQQDEQQPEEQKQQSEQQSQDENNQQEQQTEQQSINEEQTDEEQQQEQQVASENDDASNQELEALPNWLKNMTDDPSILLRRKMQLEYQKRSQSQPVKQQTNNGVIW
ncbi:hypothetical protein CW745_00930 [Psychromonas sp. psych-6C06]|uniref:tetratricopeptide repeat protein n=1 Tax=Psychromonas sp. psych-6C06 TaxID=2058089 RepID=UPI000C34F380|nr:tetratricopeptide repeat protein [Psychromonas sp. psych-6C06]PKF63443.1 hypothetical protein CW745_00930 [Psychromonas sp. psych-6C06]